MGSTYMVAVAVPRPLRKLWSSVESVMEFDGCQPLGWPNAKYRLAVDNDLDGYRLQLEAKEDPIFCHTNSFLQPTTQECE